MAPAPYRRSFSFTGSVAANPSFVPAAYGSANDSELDQVAGVSANIIASLGQIQRSDGALQNGIVTLDSLSPTILVTFQNDIAASAANAASAAGSATTAAGAATASGTASAAAAAAQAAAARSAASAVGSASAAAASAAEASQIAIPPGSITGDKLAANIDVGVFGYMRAGGTLRGASGKLGDVVSAADFSSIGAAVVACNASGRTLYVPAGNWTLSPNLTIACDLVLESGALLTVPANSSLVITGHLQAPLRYCIAYADPATSKAYFPRETATPLVPVEWFGARGPDAAHGGIYMQRAIEACKQSSIYPGPVVYFSSNTYLAGGYGLTVYPTTPIWSEPGAHIEGQSPTDGVTLITMSPGNYNAGKYRLPSLATCQTGLLMKQACLADVELQFIQNCTNGLVMDTSNGVCLDNKVHIQSISQYAQNAILISAAAASDVLQGNEIYVNVITGGLRAVLFYSSGGASVQPNWDSIKIIIQAIDGSNVSGAQGLAVAGAPSVPRLKFAVETWFGGIPDDGAFVVGYFYFSHIFLGMNDSIKSYGRMQIAGQGNKVETMDRGDDFATVAMFNTSPSTGSFNNGVPVNTPGFAVSSGPPTTIGAGGTYTAYLYSPYIRAHSNPPAVRPIAGNGWVVDSVATTSVACEAAVTFRNVTTGNNSMPSTWRVECGA